jgi:hypothetical protein
MKFSVIYSSAITFSEILSPRRRVVPSLIKIGPVVLEKEVENVNVYKQTNIDRQTDRQTMDNG